MNLKEAFKVWWLLPTVVFAPLLFKGNRVWYVMGFAANIFNTVTFLLMNYYASLGDYVSYSIWLFLGIVTGPFYVFILAQFFSRLYAAGVNK